jgi:hypothetical protein
MGGWRRMRKERSVRGKIGRWGKGRIAPGWLARESKRKGRGMGKRGYRITTRRGYSRRRTKERRREEGSGRRENG